MSLKPAACRTSSPLSSAGAINCIACPAGTYAATQASSGCVACAVGTYASAQGATNCTDCEAGTFTSTSGEALLHAVPTDCTHVPDSTRRWLQVASLRLRRCHGAVFRVGWFRTSFHIVPTADDHLALWRTKYEYGRWREPCCDRYGLRHAIHSRGIHCHAAIRPCCSRRKWDLALQWLAVCAGVGFHDQ